MACYTIDDLNIITPLQIVNKKPEVYVGERPWRPRLLQMVVSDLYFLSVFPFTVQSDSIWTSVHSPIDWLQQPGGKIDLSIFFQMRRLKERGNFAIRSELLLAALADAVVTASPNDVNWITGNQSDNPVF